MHSVFRYVNNKYYTLLSFTRFLYQMLANSIHLTSFFLEKNVINTEKKKFTNKSLKQWYE